MQNNKYGTILQNSTKYFQNHNRFGKSLLSLGKPNIALSTKIEVIEKSNQIDNSIYIQETMVCNKR